MVREALLSLHRLHSLSFSFSRDDVGDTEDISDLSWEQREQVLRLLFAKMNAKRAQRHPPALPPPPSSSSTPLHANTNQQESGSAPPGVRNSVFITQQVHPPEQTLVHVEVK